MRSLLILSLLSSPALAYQAPIDATLPERVLIHPPSLATSGLRSSGAADDFNRADGSDMGANWVETAGDMGILSNAGYGIGSSTSAMVHATLSADYATSVQVVDFLPRTSGPGVTFVAFVCAHAGTSDNLFIKVQDNTSDGTYDRVFFYKGYNGSPWGSATYYYDLAVPTTSGRMKLTFENAGDKAVLDIDTDMNGSWDEQFTCDGILAAGLSGGTGFGISSFSQGAFDNYSVNGASLEPGVAYCFGNTAAGNPCPCGNDNDGSDPNGAGCAHDDSAAGAHLGASGVASISADTLVFLGSRGPISNSTLFFQANNDQDGAGLFLGDGIRCAGGGLIRLKVKLTDTNGFADSSPMVVTTRSASFGHTIQAGETLYYQWWFRDANGSPCGTESNTSNGYMITWAP